MGFLKQLFGGAELSPEEEKQAEQQKNFDLLKYDGVKALKMAQANYALKCFEGALQIRDDLEVRDYLAQTLTVVGRLDEAMEQYARLSAAVPGNADIHLQAAQVAYLAEDYERMADECRQALALAADSPQAHYLMAQASIGQRNDIGAIAMLTKAVALDEHYADAYLLRGQTLLRMGDVKGADADAAHLLQLVGDHEDVLMLKARVERAKGNRDEAISTYGKVVDANPFQLDAYKERGQLRYEAGDTAGAKEDADKVMELDPQQLADVSGDYSAEGIEHKTRQAYSAVNPLGI